MYQAEYYLSISQHKWVNSFSLLIEILKKKRRSLRESIIHCLKLIFLSFKYIKHSMLIHFIFLYPKFCFFFHFRNSLTASYKSNEVSNFVHYFPYLLRFLLIAFFTGSPFLPCHLSSPAMASCHGSPSLIIVADTDARCHCRYGYLHNTCRRLGPVNTSSQKGLGPMRLHSLPFLKHW